MLLGCDSQEKEDEEEEELIRTVQQQKQNNPNKSVQLYKNQQD